MSITRKMGKFYVSRELVESGDISWILAEMEFSPWHVHFILLDDRFEFIGVSPLFNEMVKGDPVPEYDVKVFTCNGAVGVTVRLA